MGGIVRRSEGGMEGEQEGEKFHNCCHHVGGEAARGQINGREERSRAAKPIMTLEFSCVSLLVLPVMSSSSEVGGGAGDGGGASH